MTKLWKSDWSKGLHLFCKLLSAHQLFEKQNVGLFRKQKRSNRQFN